MFFLPSLINVFPLNVVCGYSDPLVLWAAKCNILPLTQDKIFSHFILIHIIPDKPKNTFCYRPR